MSSNIVAGNYRILQPIESKYLSLILPPPFSRLKAEQIRGCSGFHGLEPLRLGAKFLGHLPLFRTCRGMPYLPLESSVLGQGILSLM